MTFREMTIWSVCVVLAGSLLVAAGMQLDFINSQRYEMKLITNEPLENAPPSLVFATVAMGAFRGLVVDVLWMRADILKNKGQFFDAKQLAEWITILQPRFAEVWEFQSWNMAYNISAAIPATQPEERWRWVRNGYELLRDKGIELNPKNIRLYRQLSLIFQHKIGAVSDDAHKYYKMQLALSMEPMLGAADNETFKALAEAPIEWEQIIEDANVASLVTELQSADKVFADTDEFVSNYLSLRQNPHRFEPEAFKIIDYYRGTAALDKFDTFAKAYQLRNSWKLDPVFIQELNKTYGPIDWSDPNKHLPLDWRHPDSHALYWGVKGLREAGGKVFSMSETNTDRIVGHSLQKLFRGGKIFIYRRSAEERADESRAAGPMEEEMGEIFYRMDLRMFEPYNEAMVAVLGKYKEGGNRGSYISLQTGHRNMFSNAVFSFYQAGHIRQAEKYYKKLQQLYHERDEFKVPLVAYVRNRLRKELPNVSLNDAKEIIEMMQRERYFRYAMRDDDEAAGREKMAREVYDYYQSIYRDENRVNLPDFKLLRYFALVDFFGDLQYPLTLRRNLLARIQIERPDLAEQLKRVEEKLQEQLEQSQ